VPRGAERLRITPSPYHDDELIDALAQALGRRLAQLRIPLKEPIVAAE
jgi:5-aminolevulinate synthase